VLDWIRRSVARRTALVAGLAAATTAGGVWFFILRRILAGEPPEVRARILLMALLGGLTLVAVVTIAVVTTVRRLLGVPLERLTDAMATAEKGDLLVRAAGDAPDEIGALGRAFNALLRRITDQQVDIIDTDRELEETRRELELKEELAEKASIIERQNRRLETQLAELELLYDTSQAISSQLELPRLLDTLCEQAGKTLGFEEFAILLADPSSGQMVVSATFGFPAPEVVRGLRFDTGEGIAGTVARTRELLLIPDTSKDDRYLYFKGRHHRDGSFLCVPMIHRDELVGLMSVLRPRVDAFGDEDIRILTSLAATAALAISNAQLFDRIATLSMTDELTGLANRRQLQQRAGHEVEAARRYGDRLALLMIDIDHFKRFNDLHGHLRGDQVLKAVARVLRDSVRRVDTVARWGGEEFVVLLPKLGPAEAATVAEKLRAAVSGLEVGGAEALPGGRLTVSVGVAAYPEDSPEAEDLLDCADRALLQAKRTGRDRVQRFTSAASPGVAAG
jgi:diguanylate cyclase (GGDEF)-like protein